MCLIRNVTLRNKKRTSYETCCNLQNTNEHFCLLMSNVTSIVSSQILWSIVRICLALFAKSVFLFFHYVVQLRREVFYGGGRCFTEIWSPPTLLIQKIDKTQNTFPKMKNLPVFPCTRHMHLVSSALGSTAPVLSNHTEIN